jgi:hypothetical protein
VKTQRLGASDVKALLEGERGIPVAPPHLRARAVLRARRAVVEGGAVSPVLLRPERLKWATAAVGVLVLATLATAAIGRRQRPATTTAPPSPRATGVAPRIAAPDLDLTSFDASPDAPPSPRATRPPRRSPSQAEEYARELRLLQPARAAIARDDFDVALAATAAHERRFPRGRLAEEREALRILALAGSRRWSEARVAAAAFHGQFPESLLGKRVDDAVRGLP